MGRLSFWGEGDRAETLRTLYDIHPGKKKEKGVKIKVSGPVLQDGNVFYILFVPSAWNKQLVVWQAPLAVSIGEVPQLGVRSVLPQGLVGSLGSPPAPTASIGLDLPELGIDKPI